MDPRGEPRHGEPDYTRPKNRLVVQPASDGSQRRRIDANANGVRHDHAERRQHRSSERSDHGGRREENCAESESPVRRRAPSLRHCTRHLLCHLGIRDVETQREVGKY